MKKPLHIVITGVVSLALLAVIVQSGFVTGAHATQVVPKNQAVPGEQAAGLSARSADASGTTFRVGESVIRDQKAVFASVESVDMVSARVRIGGTVVELGVDEGSPVKAGQVIARVVDKKLALRMKSLNANIQSLRSQLDLARIALARAEKLFKGGAIPRARLDEARTNAEVTGRSLVSAKAARQVLEQTRTEGEVLAPTKGRVLKVFVTKGSVVLPGDEVANMAAEAYILRLRLPERHARFIRKGDLVQVAPRGFGALSPSSSKKLRIGRVRQVYPEIKQGRVIADVDVPGLGDFFVGERIRVWISTGKRKAIVVPQGYLYSRYGLNFVKLTNGSEVVVQPGMPQQGGVEVLSGLNPGDVLVHP